MRLICSADPQPTPIAELEDARLMLNQTNVKLLLSYLDECRANQEPATLVGAMWYVDGRNKLLPCTDEMNEALRFRADLFVQRTGKTVVIGAEGSEREVTVDDMNTAACQYHKEFWGALRPSRAQEG